jgi:hypothetical protein
VKCKGQRFLVGQSLCFFCFSHHLFALFASTYFTVSDSSHFTPDWYRGTGKAVSNTALFLFVAVVA